MEKSTPWLPTNGLVAEILTAGHAMAGLRCTCQLMPQDAFRLTQRDPIQTKMLSLPVNAYERAFSYEQASDGVILLADRKVAIKKAQRLNPRLKNRLPSGKP